jgi:hypothetical protein
MLEDSRLAGDAITTRKAESEFCLFSQMLRPRIILHIPQVQVSGNGLDAKR